MRHQRSRSAAVEVGAAKAFVDSMEVIDGFKRLEKGWAGEGTKAPSAKAMGSATRVMKDRQAMAGRLTVAAGGAGDIRIHFICGEMADGEPGHVHIDKDGKPAIITGDERDEDAAHRHVGVASKTFRKALDALISPRTGRYGIKRVEVDGIIFDSADEGKRYRILKSEEAMGVIRDLRMQVAYPYAEKGRHCFTYKSDFNFTVAATGEEVVEDVKGVKTPVYNLKKKLIEARYDIEITEWPVSKKEMARRQAVAERKRLAAEKEERKRQRAEAAEQRRQEKARLAAERAERKAAKAAGA